MPTWSYICRHLLITQTRSLSWTQKFFSSLYLRPPTRTPIFHLSACLQGSMGFVLPSKSRTWQRNSSINLIVARGLDTKRSHISTVATYRPKFLGDFLSRRLLSPANGFVVALPSLLYSVPAKRSLFCKAIRSLSRREAMGIAVPNITCQWLCQDGISGRTSSYRRILYLDFIIHAFRSSLPLVIFTFEARNSSRYLANRMMCPTLLWFGERPHFGVTG